MSPSDIETLQAQVDELRIQVLELTRLVRRIAVQSSFDSIADDAISLTRNLTP